MNKVVSEAQHVSDNSVFNVGLMMSLAQSGAAANAKLTV